MQLKLLFLSLATAVIAIPSAADDSILEARAPPTKWEAKGGCKTDWGGRCLNQCKSEARSMGQTCRIGSNIWKSDCWLGWSVCTCYCKR